MTRILIIGFFLLGIGAELLAQETIAPQLLCATTDINGDVTLTWGESAETCGPFVEYNVFAATDIAGPYTLIGTVTDVLTTTYTHIGRQSRILRARP